ncbi:MAG: Uma2 family endonuclease [Pyrinomonadaceae bacterium]
MTTVLEQPPEVKEAARQDGVLELRLFTVEEYERMAEVGILGRDERLELIDGVIIKMSPKGDPHCAATDRAARYFIKRMDDKVIVRNQNPIRLDNNAEPEPDIVLATPQEKEYSDRKPTPQEILLVLEVADTTLYSDRRTKALIYARAGIQQYCILNLKARELEDYRDPSSEGYRSKQTYKAEQSFSLVAFPEVVIAVGELLPPE